MLVAINAWKLEFVKAVSRDWTGNIKTKRIPRRRPIRSAQGRLRRLARDKFYDFRLMIYDFRFVEGDAGDDRRLYTSENKGIPRRRPSASLRQAPRLTPGKR